METGYVNHVANACLKIINDISKLDESLRVSENRILKKEK